MKYISLSKKIIFVITPLGIVFTLVYFSFSGNFSGKELYYREVVPQPGIGEDVPVASSSLSILFIGDMMFDRYIRKMSYKYGEDFLFSCISPLLLDHTVVVGNLEGPITTKPSTSMDSVIGSPENYSFTFPTSTAALLFRNNIRIVSIGNNHIDNQGITGIVQTKKFLTDANVSFFGGLAGDETIYRTVESGVPISFIAYNQFGGEKEAVVQKSIKEEKASGRLVIVYAHWGEEYVGVTQAVRATAQGFVDSGADFIVGTHPHVVQSHEVIGTTPAYYSLGNFIFDQYFDKDVMKGLALSVTISPDHKLSIKEHTLSLGKDGRTCLSR